MSDVETALHGLRVGLEFSEVSVLEQRPSSVRSLFCHPIVTARIRFPLATSRLLEPLIALLMADLDRLISDHTSIQSVTAFDCECEH